MRSHDLANQLLTLPDADILYDDGEDEWDIDDVEQEGGCILLITDDDGEDDPDGEVIDVEKVA